MSGITIVHPEESSTTTAIKDFQHHVGEEGITKADEVTHPAATLQTASSLAKRPALSSQFSQAHSSFLSASSNGARSPEFSDISSRFSSKTDFGFRNTDQAENSLGSSSSTSKSDEVSAVKQEISQPNRLQHLPSTIGSEQSNLGPRGSKPFSGVAKTEAINPISPTDEPRTLDLQKPLVHRNQADNVGRRGGEATSQDDNIEAIEPQQARAIPTAVANTSLGSTENYATAAEYYEAASQGLFACVTTATPKLRPDATDEKLAKAGRRRIFIQKYSMQAAQISINGTFIFITWWWMRYYYILLPFITATVALNVIMIVSVLLRKTINTISPEKKVVPETPESIVLLVPCYNETKQELENSLNCLVAQEGIEQHKRAILIVCDGKVRGPGMEKTTAHYLLNEILTHQTERKYLRGAYLAWDQQFMDVVYQTGTYGGIPYMCVVKQQNQGKRDGLIFVRSFLYKFNLRAETPTTQLTSKFFARMTSWLLHAGFDRVDSVVGMDADTRFETQCIKNLLEESRYPKTVGVCGYVMVDFSPGQWSLWRLYQSAEYTIAQGLRRLHQSLVTKKVSCLPGCCQLLKICEETCGDEVLIERFGYCPTVNDGLLAHIRATASEDRNHVCQMLSARPQSQTRQALAARAVTDVPHSWSVFLSQRRRWTLGATSNDLLLTFAPGVNWFERILACVNVFTWFLSPFIIASLASFIYAIFHAPYWIILAFVGVMLIPIVYYLCIPLWITKSWRERFQFYLGCFLYVFCGPFIAITVLIYAVWNMDSFGWGKTRKVVATDDSSEDENSSQIMNLSEKSSEADLKNKSKNPEVRNPDRMDEAAREEKRVGTGGA